MARILKLLPLALLLTIGAGPAKDDIIRGPLLQPGEFKVGPYSPRCGSVQTFLADDLPVGGAALAAPGRGDTVRLIVMNPKNLRRTSDETKLFVYSHECGHHLFGESEVAADCYAAMRGRQEGWLTEKRLDKTCRMRYIHLKGSLRYPPGTLRCRIQRYCFAAANHRRPLDTAYVRRVSRAALDRVVPVADFYLRAERDELNAMGEHER